LDIGCRRQVVKKEIVVHALQGFYERCTLFLWNYGPTGAFEKGDRFVTVEADDECGALFFGVFELFDVAGVEKVKATVSKHYRTDGSWNVGEFIKAKAFIKAAANIPEVGGLKNIGAHMLDGGGGEADDAI
jgi:hypothetical protein